MCRINHELITVSRDTYRRIRRAYLGPAQVTERDQTSRPAYAGSPNRRGWPTVETALLGAAFCPVASGAL